MVFVGVQPSFTQHPPTCSRSINAVRNPAFASSTHNGVPPWPEPITIAWNSSITFIEMLLGLGEYHAIQQELWVIRLQSHPASHRARLCTYVLISSSFAGSCST